MPHLRINFFIFFYCITVVFAEKPLVESLLKEIPKHCMSREEVEYHVHYFELCFQNIVRTSKDYGLRAGSDAAVNELCKLDLTECITKLGNHVKRCLNSKQYKDIFSDTVSAVVAGQRYICSDNGKTLKEFMIRSPQCFSNTFVLEQAQKCSQKYASVLNEWSTQSFNSDDACQQWLALSSCMVNAFDNCEDKYTRNFFKNLMISILSQTNCKRFTYSLNPQQVQSSSSQPSSPTAASETDHNSSTSTCTNNLLIPFIFISIYLITHI